MSITSYDYKVRNRAGKVVSGTIAAESEAEASRKLLSSGVPLQITRSVARRKGPINIGPPKRVKLKDLAVFTRMFATMTASGLTLLGSLTILSEQSANPELGRVLGLLRRSVENGAPLSAAMTEYPKVFPPIMTSMTKAGEIGGFLDVAMLQLAESFEAEVRLSGKIKAALTYPVVVFVLAMLMCLGMLIFVVPVFSTMFESLGGALPLPTQVLVWLSGLLRTGIPILIILAIGSVVAWRKYARLPAVRAVLDPLKLKLPVFGKLFQKIALTRFARNFSTLLSSGVPVLQCLETVGETTGSVVIGAALRDVGRSVRQGESLSLPLTQHKVFPPMVVQMMAVGEDTGELASMLGRIAQFYDQEVEAATASLTATIEPLMIAFLGIIVGSMIVALYLPIFSVFNLIQ